MTTNAPNPPRTAKRYPYQITGQCMVGEKIFSVQLINISASGVQFVSMDDIPDNQPISLAWSDPKLELFNTTLAVVRKINQEGKFYYGSRYYNLTPETKDKLIKLLKNIKEQQKQAIKRDVDRVTPEYLLDVIKGGREFLKEIFSRDHSELLLGTVYSTIKDYEKISFESSDKESNYIQEITINTFHCKLLGLMLPMILERPEFKIPFLEQITRSLEVILETENRQDAVLAASADKSLRPLIIESSNRLFFEKQMLLQATIETLGMFELEGDAASLFDQVKNEYDRVLALTNPETKAMQVTYARKPSQTEKTKDEIIDVPAISDHKPRTLLWVNILILTAFAIIFILYQFSQSQDLNDVRAQMNLPIKIQSFRKVGPQIDLVVSESDWADKSNEEKTKIFERLYEFLKEDKRLQFALLMVEGKGMVRMINDEEANFAPPEPSVKATLEDRMNDPNAVPMPEPEAQPAKEETTEPQ